LSGDRHEASGIFAAAVGTAAIAALSRQARAQTAVKEIRIGYQKNGVLVIARQQARSRNISRPRDRGEVDRILLGPRCWRR